MDLFQDYLNRHRDDDTCVALVAKSYRNVYQKKHRCPLPESKTNGDLATYGDALLRFSLVSIFLGKAKKLSEEITGYLTDKFLIENIAKHYHLLDYIFFDRKNDDIPEEYTFYENESTKYIATTVEAIIGDIYRECRDMDAIIAMVDGFTKLKQAES